MAVIKTGVVTCASAMQYIFKVHKPIQVCLALNKLRFMAYKVKSFRNSGRSLYENKTNKMVEAFCN